MASPRLPAIHRLRPACQGPTRGRQEGALADRVLARLPGAGGLLGSGACPGCCFLPGEAGIVANGRASLLGLLRKDQL